MKYKEIVKIIKNISLALPDVQSFYTGDVYEVNADQSVKYGSVVLTNQEHTFDNINDRFQYNFVLFYIDRLTDDEANRVDVHTAAVSALKAIVQHLEDYNVIINDFKFNLFRERFNDQCAGAYATLSVVVEANDCTEDFSFDFGQITPDKLKEISITTNGVYTPDDGYYYTKVSVNVQPSLQTKTIEITENGTSTIVADSDHYGLRAVDVSVNVPTPTFSTEELSVTANGTYTPNTDGYSKVTVAVPIPEFTTEELSVTENGSYTPSTDGYSKVNVNVPIPEPNLQTKSIEITENGTQTISADNGYDGLSSVSVTTNISGSTTSDKIKMIDGMKLNYTDRSIDYYKLDFSQVTDFKYMFAYSDINSVPIIDTSEVTNMMYIFSGCDNLWYVENIANWDVRNVIYMNGFFYNCSEIYQAPDLSKWKLNNLIDMSDFFNGYQSDHGEINMCGLVFPMVGTMRRFWGQNVFTPYFKMDSSTVLPKINLTDWKFDYYNWDVTYIMYILNALPQLSSSESFTCTIGSTNLAKLTDAQKAIATNKNWILN